VWLDRDRCLQFHNFDTLIWCCRDTELSIELLSEEEK
jgi:hypothetical protein